MNARKNSFHSENAMVRHARVLLRNTLRNFEGDLRVRYEVTAPGVIPDMVVFNVSANTVQYVITVEFKLKNWNRALKQAFRHRNFVNEAYVVLDHSKAASAINHLDKFRRANVGLLTLDVDGNVRAWHYPEPGLPFSTTFSRKMAQNLLSTRKTIPESLPFTKRLRGGKALEGLKRAWGEPLSESDFSQMQLA